MMDRPAFRPPPALPPGAMKTYAIFAPRSTHHRPATCTEANCQPHVYGWVTRVDESTDLGKAQAYYIRNEARRRYTEDRQAAMTTFTFEAGQECFSSPQPFVYPDGRTVQARHLVRVDRPEIYVVRDGDFRGNPRGTKPLVHRDPQGWVDDFGEHQEKLADRIGRG